MTVPFWHIQPRACKTSNKCAAATKFGLTVSLRKTEVMMQAAPEQTPPVPRITIEGTELKQVSWFNYLGSIVQDDVNLDSDIANRIYRG